MSDEKKEQDLHLVVYTDGGCRPSRGFGGYGFHGYIHDGTTPKQGAGAKATPTKTGYAEGKQKERAVTVIEYVDCWASIGSDATNNEAELLAAVNALRFARDRELKSILIYTDSAYVCDGLNDWLETWIAKGWVKQDGSEVVNRALWEELLAEKNALSEKGIEISINWVRGHSGDLGNSMADLLATRGVFLARKGIDDKICTVADGKGYWNIKVDVNRMLSKSCWYFNTNVGDTMRSPDGRYVYHLGAHGNDDSMLGKRMSDSSFSVVYLSKPEPVLETVRSYQDSMTDGIMQSVIVGRLSALMTPRHYHDILTYGDRHLDTTPKRIDLINAENVPLTNEMRPARLAYRAVDMLVALESLLEEYVATQDDGKRHFIVTDITDQLFDVEVSTKGKKTCKLKKEIGTDVKYIEAEIDYDTQDNKGSLKSKLLLNMDLPSRNTLSAIASQCPTVKVITWPESPKAFRIASIVECGEDIGIWSSIHSNLRVLE